MGGNRDSRRNSMTKIDVEPVSLVDLLRRRAVDQAGKRAYTFLVDGKAQEETITYQRLDLRARAIGAWLQSVGAMGERALLLFPPGLNYIAVFFGCLYAKVAAVPAYPPRPNRGLDRLRAIVGDAQPRLILTEDRLVPLIEPLLDPKSLRCQPVEAIEDCLATEWKAPEIKEDTLAFLQYTSGSTAAPKGVMVSHGNLLQNEGMITRAFRQTEQSIIVGWLPLFHDMGLIGNVLQTIYVGAQSILMSPMAFLQRPLNWLEAVSRYQATTSGGPDFAYDLCVRKITPEQRDTLDLRSWSVAFNGSEQVHSETMERFSATFASCGFRREAFYPCYGLAEATLFVSGRQRPSGPIVQPVHRTALDQNLIVPALAEDRDVRDLTSCGTASVETRIKIVDPKSLTECQLNRVGEIWVQGPSVAQGYWNRPDESEDAFQAHLAGSGEGPYLRTGDLGFIQDGDLYITGRLKNVIIIRGRNHYPEDLERTAQQSHPGLRPGCGAAFSVEIAGQERLVVIQEIERSSRNVDLDEVVGAIRKAIAEEHELHAYAVVLCKPGGVPKTSSGKIQRQSCRDAFLSGTLAFVERSIPDPADNTYCPRPSEDCSGENKPATGITRPQQQQLESALLEQVARVLKIAPSRIPLQQPLSRLGLDSLMAIELQNNIESSFSVFLPMASFLQDASISQLAAQIKADPTGLIPEPSLSRAGRAKKRESYPLSYGQYRLWFVDHLEPGNSAYNISGAFLLTGQPSAFALEQAVSEIVIRHDVLRATFVLDGDHPLQVIDQPRPVTISIVDLDPASSPVISKLAAEEARRAFKLTEGPLYRFKLLRLGAAEQVLLLSLHHIISDGWSVGVFLRELAALCDSYISGNVSPLNELPVQYADFTTWQQEWLQGEILQTQLSYWKRKFAAPASQLNLPADRPRPAKSINRGACHELAVSRELSNTLKTLGHQEGSTLFMTLLTGFKVMLHYLTEQTDIIVGSPVAGRNHSKFEKLIGFFLNTLVLRTDVSSNPTLRELISRVRQVALEAYENQDLPFERLVSEVVPERDLNRLPLYQVWFVLQIEPVPTLTLPAFTLSPLEVTWPTLKVDLALNLTETPEGIKGRFEYDRDLFHASTIADWGDDFIFILERMAKQPDTPLAELKKALLRRTKQRLINEAQAYEGILHESLKKTRRQRVSSY
jgi:acyl-CoA synthetase (AMP-forming)/AMP-acid ligase II/acyl carrier protein